MNTEKLVARVDALIALGERGLASAQPSSYSSSREVDNTLFHEFRAASLSFIEWLFGRDHTYYKEFNSKVENTYEYYTKYGLGILKGIKKSRAAGWASYAALSHPSSSLTSSKWLSICWNRGTRIQRRC